MLNASIAQLNPRYLFALCWLCKLIGAELKAWKVRRKREVVA